MGVVPNIQTCQDVTGTPSGGQTLVYDIASAKHAYRSTPSPRLNLAHDPYHAQYLRHASATTDGRGRFQGAGFVVVPGDANSPFETPVMKRTNFSTSLINRRFWLDEMGLFPGDTVTMMLAYVPPPGRASSSYFQTALFLAADESTVLGSVLNLLTTVNYPTFNGLIVAYKTRQLIPASAAVIVMASNYNAGETLSESVVAWGVYKSDLDATNEPVERYLADLLGPLPLRNQVRVVLPRKTYALVGGTGSPTAIEEANLYFRSCVQRDASHAVALSASSKGRAYADKWRIQPGNSAIADYNVSADATQVAVTINVVDTFENVVTSGTTTVELVDKSKTSRVSVLTIGDSYTWVGTYVSQIAAVLPGTVDMVGTGTNDDGTHGFEGNNGWQLTDHQQNLYSRFIFPASIAGAAYKGNVAFWKNAVTGEAERLPWQKAATGWHATPYAGNYLFDSSTGYPTSPATGDVVYDPAQTAGSEFQKYNGSAWAALTTADATGTSIAVGSVNAYTRAAGSFVTDSVVVGSMVYAFGFATSANNGVRRVTAVSATSITVSPGGMTVEASSSSKAYVPLLFSFAKYFARYAFAFNQTGSFHRPDYVSVLLGHNESYFAIAGLDNASSGTWAGYTNALTALIAARDAYDSTIKLILCGPNHGSDQDAFAISGYTNLGLSFAQYQRNVFDFNQRLLALYDNDVKLALGIYVCCPGHNVDPAAYTTTTENRSKFDSTAITRFSNALHPTTGAGYLQLGDAIAATIQRTRS